MAKNKNKRLRPAVLQEDLEAYAALQAIENYNPSNPDFSLAKVKAVFDSILEEQTLEVQKNVAEAQRDKTVAKEWEGHEMILGVRVQLKAQFGEDSDEYASSGMKKKERIQNRRAQSDDQ